MRGAVTEYVSEFRHFEKFSIGWWFAKPPCGVNPYREFESHPATTCNYNSDVAFNLKDRVLSIVYEVRTKSGESTALERTGPQRDNLSGRYAPGGQCRSPETRAEPRLFELAQLRQRP